MSCKVYEEYATFPYDALFPTWICLIYGYLKAGTDLTCCCLRLTNTRTAQNIPNQLIRLLGGSTYAQVIKECAQKSF